MIEILIPSPISRAKAASIDPTKQTGSHTGKFYAEIDALGLPQARIRHCGANKQNQDIWEVEIFGHEFTYFTGSAHRAKVKISAIQVNTYPVIPHVGEVLLAAFSDSMCANDTFADYCENFGYDEDSRRALAQYLACQESGRKLRKLQIPGLLEVLEKWSSEL